MVITEKIILLVCLFAGFFWIRNRSRQIDLESRMLKSILGVFIILPGALLCEKLLFEKIHFGAWQDIAIKVVVIAITFLVVGLVFLKPNSAEESV